MKKKVLILLLVVCSLMITGCKKDEVIKYSKDALKFKKEYESINGQNNADGKKHRIVSISKENPFVYATADEIVKKIENEETFYVYFGDTNCPWCRSTVETAIKVAKENNIKEIYYVKIWGEDHEEILRDKYQLNKKNKLELVSEGTESYKKLLNYFDNVLSDYTLTTEKGKSVKVGEKRIFAPNYIYVKKGKAKKLVEGISEKQTDSREELTEEILKDEEKLFTEFFAK